MKFGLSTEGEKMHFFKKKFPISYMIKRKFWSLWDKGWARVTLGLAMVVLLFAFD